MPVSYPFIPSTSFLRGHLPEMQQDTYNFYLQWHQRYGDYLKLKALPSIEFYSFSHPDAFHHILVKNRDKYSRGARWRKIVGYLGGNGLVTSDGEYWRSQRKRMTPFFQMEKVESYVDFMARNALSVIEKLKQQPEKHFDVSEMMTFLGLINVCDALFHYDIRDDSARFSEAMRETFAFIQRLIVDPFRFPPIIPTPSNLRFKQQLRLADHVAYQIIESKTKHSGEISDDSMVNVLIKENKLTKRQLRDEIITLLMAGHDTTATALSWAWHLLANHPEVVADVQRELQSVLKGNLPKAEDIAKLVYTKKVVEEVLRLYPSVWSMHRFSEIEDEVNGYHVKKGRSLALPLYVTHRHPDYWEKPNVFYPQHFDASACQKRPRFAYLPFGAGERICIGGHFAMTEAITLLAVLLQYMIPTLKEGQTISPLIAFTLQPSQNIVGTKVFIK